MYSLHKLLAAVIFLLIARVQPAFAQDSPQDIDRLIRHKDSLFWQAYNVCDVAAMMQQFTEDLEFYHDKGGITTGKTAFTSSIQKGLCGKEGYKLRREAIEETVQVFPMQEGGKVYGAIISGEHLFYVTDGGKPEFLDGHARFAQLWLLKEGKWKMARVLSFDHKPAVYKAKQKEITLPAATLKQYSGTYKGKEKGIITIKNKAPVLALTAGANTFTLYASAPDVFFLKDKNVTFQFNRNKEGKVYTLTISENGAVVEEAFLEQP